MLRELHSTSPAAKKEERLQHFVSTDLSEAQEAFSPTPFFECYRN
jgi:hypothetical protein